MKSLWGWIIGAVVIAAIIIGIVAATGSDKKSNNTTTQNTTSSSTNNKTDTSTSASPTQADKVTIRDLAFSPAHITVKKGTTVTWTNNDGTAHTVSGDLSTGPSSGNLGSGDTYTFTFNSAGTFGYHCNIHQDMHGTVTVTE